MLQFAASALGFIIIAVDVLLLSCRENLSKNHLHLITYYYIT